jgi:hypothetical protein
MRGGVEGVRGMWAAREVERRALFGLRAEDDMKAKIELNSTEISHAIKAYVRDKKGGEPIGNVRLRGKLNDATDELELSAWVMVEPAKKVGT